MKYQLVPKTGWNVSKLSFGCMRFKDHDTAVEAVRKAVELGVNYFDVAPCYGGGTAEPFLGDGIKGLRDKAIITAKSSPGNGGEGLCDYNPKDGFGIRTADEARRQIERSMKLFGVDHLDMYQFWALHSEEIFKEGMKPGGFFEGVLKAYEEGLFDYIGMTTHSQSADIIHFIKDSPYEFDMVTLPFHLLDAGRTEAIAYCAERGIGVVAMNPLGGGRLGRRSATFRKLARQCGLQSMVEGSLRFAADTEGVTTALCGLTFAEQVIEGAAAIDRGPLTADVAARLMAGMEEIHRHVNPGQLCTACGYCGQCPEGVSIPVVLGLYIDMLVPSTAESARAEIKRRLAAEEQGLDPAACTACKRCEGKCPNSIPVSQMMRDASAIWPRS